MEYEQEKSKNAAKGEACKIATGSQNGATQPKRGTDARRLDPVNQRILSATDTYYNTIFTTLVTPGVDTFKFTVTSCTRSAGRPASCLRAVKCQDQGPELPAGSIVAAYVN
jgi:hypothetical protein